MNAGLVQLGVRAKVAPDATRECSAWERIQTPRAVSSVRLALLSLSMAKVFAYPAYLACTTIKMAKNHANRVASIRLQITVKQLAV